MRFPCPLGEELGSHWSPKGELPAKPGEGVNPRRRRPPPFRFARCVPLTGRNDPVIAPIRGPLRYVASLALKPIETRFSGPFGVF